MVFVVLFTKHTRDDNRQAKGDAEGYASPQRTALDFSWMLIFMLFLQSEWSLLPLARPAVCWQSRVTGNLGAAKAQWQIAGRRVSGNKRTTTKSAVQGWVWAALTQTQPLTTAFLEQFVTSECAGHSALRWGRAGGRRIHGDDIIAFSFPCALAPVTAFCFELRLGKNFFCFIVSQERVLVQALYS